MILRILLAAVLVWAIFRFFRILLTSIQRAQQRQQNPPRESRSRVRKQESLKADDVIDVDYTESSSQDKSDPNKEH